MASPQTWRYPALLPLSGLYRGAVRWRNRAYDRKVFQTVRLPATVVSIGNLSVGGTGKTPMAALLANTLTERHFRVAIVARGYHREGKGVCIVSDGRGTLADLKNAGDEPLLLAQECPRVPVVVARSKTAAAQLAVNEFSPEIILVDDGFQHRRLLRDLDFVLLPVSHLLPGTWLLPAGPLREPWSSLRRAHWIGLIGISHVPVEKQKEVLKIVRGNSRASVISINFIADRVEHLWGQKSLAIKQLRNARVLLVSGIANPQRFHLMAAELGSRSVGELEYRDHHQFTRAEAQGMVERFRASGADFLITTAKDGVKLRQFEILKRVPVFVLEIRPHIAPAEFAALLASFEQTHMTRKSSL
jgi:tetraacyldisaccharide 4'-kinase